MNTSYLPYKNELRDCLWMWGHETGVYDGPGNKYQIPVSEPIGMAHACGYMGIPNVCSVRWETCGKAHLWQYRGMTRFGWIIGHNPTTYAKLCPFAESLVPAYPNLTAFELDDFFDNKPEEMQPDPKGGEKLVSPATLTLQELDDLKKRMKTLAHPVELRIVLYARQLKPSIVPALSYADTVLLWTWNGADIAKLTDNYRLYRSMMPDKPTLLGIYMWDFGDKKPLELGFMKQQLDQALKWWKEREINGLIFHCTPLVNKDLPAVEYCREWIAEHAMETR
ncbi:MAG: hypothetical protein IKR81_14640 [Victivallales bacterium]|nr:hypothetical protein [Victivallales bacterium]